MGPTQIASDATGVYWINDGGAMASTIMKKPLPTGDAEVLVTAPDATTKFLAIAVSGGSVYYTHGSDIHQVSAADGGDDVVVGTAINFDLMPPAPAGEPAGLVVNGTKMFWTTKTRQGVEGDDTAPDHTEESYVELGESQGNLLLQDIATDGTNGYWVDGAKVQRATMKPPVEVTSTPDFDDIDAFTINATDVYFVTANGKVYKHSIMPPASADAAVPPTVLFRDQVKSNAIVLDATKAYWSSDCTIRSGSL
jgi:hypothetical protein